MVKLRILFVMAFLLMLVAGSIRAQQQHWSEGFGHGIKLSDQQILENFDYLRQEIMIPMRDGAKLYTIILIPKREEKMPILLTRTPYSASVRSTPEQRRHLKDVLIGGNDIFADSGYIRIFQDIRGRFRSEGEYVVTRPLRGPLNPTRVDHSTDTYDTIQWLLENIPESNGRVGMIGTSYDGFLVLMGIVDPHPAMKVAVSVNPMVDGWMGDDWFHNGAFRQMAIDFLNIHFMPDRKKKDLRGNVEDDYTFFLQQNSVGDIGRLTGNDRIDFWNQLLEHPAYDSFWRDQAMDRVLAERSLKVPTLYVHSLWDQEDIYGAIAAYLATESKDTDNDRNFLAIGPWNHGGSHGSGNSLGAVKFNSDTGRYFRREILLPFLNEHLKEGAVKADTPPVLAFETGKNSWEHYDAWPLSCDSGCPYPMTALYLQSETRLDFIKPEIEKNTYDGFVSDPMSPVPYRARPIQPVFFRDSSWGLWLVDDQEMFTRRPDVLSYQTEVLERPLRVSGRPVAELFASTSGSDMDLVVKLIDGYPDPCPEQPEMAGYQLMISADIFRGRYRKDPSNPSPVLKESVELYRWELPAATHVFLPGHRIMIQIQSSWFPLYDRNPQTYVENIFNAVSGDFQKAEHKIYRSGNTASSIKLPIIKD